MSSNPETVKKNPSRQRWIVILLVILGLCITTCFMGRAATSFIRLRRMQMQPLTGNVEQIRGWMTIPHVARLYRVPEEVLFEALGLPAGETYRNRSLNQINREFFAGQPMVVLRIVRTTILEYYAAHPEIQPPPGMPPAPTLVAPPGNVPAPTPLEAPKPSTRDLRHRYWPGQRWSPIDFSQ